MNFGLKQIQIASQKIEPYIIKTPLIRLSVLDEILGCEVYVKAENMQKTGAFKLRGAVNKVLSLSKEEIDKGIIAVSSGNHGKAVAYLAKQLGAKATVIMHDKATKTKIDAIKALGATVILCDASERFNVAEQLCQETGATMAPPYNDEYIMAGQGTVGLEIMEQCKDINSVIVPVSGGGLISGVSTAIKETNPNIKVYGAEPAVIPRYSKSVEKDEIVTVPANTSIADALPSLSPGIKCFPYAKKNVDKFLAVEEEYILKATKLLLLEGKIFAETSACIGIGAVMQGLVKFDKKDKVCFVLSGGNAGLNQLKTLEEI